MVASTFGAAFDKLPRETQRGIARQLSTRHKTYTFAMTGQSVSGIKAVLLGDTPGPGRPTAQGYHHTPFYSTKNSSLWINKQLVEAGIDEKKLVWFNTTLADGTKLDPEHVRWFMSQGAQVICLGGAAKKWFTDNFDADAHITVYHPQAWKRFHAKDEYPLIPILKNL